MPRYAHTTFCLAVVALLALHAPASARAQGADALPIFDAHMHYSQHSWQDYPANAVLRKMAAAGVLRGVVSSTPDEGTLNLVHAAPRRFVPELRPYRQGVTSGNWVNDGATPDYLRGRLGLATYVGVGEFHLFDAESARTGVVRQVAALSVERGLLLHIHSDAGPVQAIFDYEPRARVLWAHAGMSTPPGEVRALVERHPNLWVELSFREHEIYGGGSLHPVWRALLTEHRERFVVGTDTYTPSRWASYESIVANHRRYLALLPPEVAQAIAYGNAVRLFGDPDGLFPKP
jgi:hypothetical protein